MKARRVRFTETASRQVDREHAWWLANRESQDLFATELEAAMRTLAVLPGVGTAYVRTDVPDLRRLYLRKLVCHLYYTFDDDEVIVRALWSARREHGPAL